MQLEIRTTIRVAPKKLNYENIKLVNHVHNVFWNLQNASVINKRRPKQMKIYTMFMDWNIPYSKYFNTPKLTYRFNARPIKTRIGQSYEKINVQMHST